MHPIVDSFLLRQVSIIISFPIKKPLARTLILNITCLLQ